MRKARILFAIIVSAGTLPAITGNIPLDKMKSEAAQIVAGVLQEITNTSDGSIWTVQVVRIYKGGALQSTTKARFKNSLAATRIDTLSGIRGLFMIGTDGALLRRTGGSSLLTDWYVPAPQELSSAKNTDVAFCVDWMRGLTNPAVPLMRDLAIAAADCGLTQELADGIRTELGGSPKTTDALIVILVRLAHSDPAALSSLESWLRDNPDPKERFTENIAWGLLGYASPDADGSFALRRLALSARSPLVRELAASVLTYIHSEETWSDLAALLDSPDRRVRWLALNGLQQAVDAGERGGAPGAFERPLMHLGKPVARTAKKRPEVPTTARVAAAQATDDTALVQFWREYAARNR